MNIHISTGNIKLGSICNISLPPIITCEENVPCSSLCYARKAYEGYAQHTCKPAWDENLAFYQSDPDGYFNEIDKFLLWLERKEAKKNNLNPRFRWHVSGDVPDPEYWKNVKDLADLYPAIDFAIYTRRRFILSNENRGSVPPNLHVRESVWLGEKPTSDFIPFTVIGKKEEPPEAYVPCKGNCRTCWLCFSRNTLPTFNRLH